MCFAHHRSSHCFESDFVYELENTRMNVREVNCSFFILIETLLARIHVLD